MARSGCRVRQMNSQSLLEITSESHALLQRRCTFLSAAYCRADWGCRGGACPLALPSCPSLCAAERLGLTEMEGCAVWFGSHGSIDSFKVESTCHCFNHLWPGLHVGGARRGPGSAALFLCGVSERKREREGNRKKRPELIRTSVEPLFNPTAVSCAHQPGSWNQNSCWGLLWSTKFVYLA